MLISEKNRLLKRLFQKKQTTDLAIRLKIFAEKNYPEDLKFIRRMERQIDCCNRLSELKDGRIISRFCGQKTCYICNTMRRVKFTKKYLEEIKTDNYKYHLVLTCKNPDKENLKEIIDKMYKFFSNSNLRKNKNYKKINNKIKMIRSFECTLNTEKKSFNVHFHCLLSNSDENDLILYGNTIINYWLKYFGNKANRAAQYFSPREKSELENFKYLMKLNDINNLNMEMFYYLLQALFGKRLFMAKNIKAIKDNNDELEEINQEYYNKKKEIINFYFYSEKNKNYINPDNKEVLLIN